MKTKEAPCGAPWGTPGGPELRLPSRVGSLMARATLVLPFLAVGYALLCLALALWLGRWLTLIGGLGTVGAANVLLAAVLGAQVWAELRKRKLLGGTVQSVRELERTAALLREGTHAG